MFAGTWAKKLSLTLLGAAALTLGTANLSHAQTNTFDPAAPGAPIPNSNGLTFDGFNSAIDGADNAVAAADGSATIRPVPPLTLFEFFGVDLSKPNNSSINFVQIEAFLNGESLYTEVVDISFGPGFFSSAASGLPSTVSSLIFTGFATSPSGFSAFSAFSLAPMASAAFGGDEPIISTSSYDDYYSNPYHEDCFNTVFYIDNLQTEAVPEPTTMLGLMVASGGLAVLKRKRSQKKEA